MNKESIKKVPRGQMIYAPISSLSSAQKPSKFILNSSMKQNNDKNSLSAKQKQQTSTIKDQISSIQQLNQKVIKLRQQNQSLKKKQLIYLNKLQKLESGLQKQHQQFRSLQILYTQLFTTYKQKQDEICSLQQRYKQTERQRHQSAKQSQPTHQQVFKNTVPRQNPYNSFNVKAEDNICKEKLFQQSITNQISALIMQNQRLNQTNQNLLSEITYLRSKDKLEQSRQLLSKKVLQEVTHMQNLHQQGNQHKIQLEYQNQYLIMRNQDLEKSLSQLQKIISLKQSEIIRMREDKMSMHRKSSQKMLSKSPQKHSSDSANKRIQTKKLYVLIQNLQKQNNRLRSQNLELRNFSKSTIKQMRQLRPHSTSQLMRKLNFAQKDNISNDSFSHLKQNVNSQNLQQYFSFSRQKQDQELPSFPLDLEIQNIIQKHQKNFLTDRIQNKIQ